MPAPEPTATELQVLRKVAKRLAPHGRAEKAAAKRMVARGWLEPGEFGGLHLTDEGDTVRQAYAHVPTTGATDNTARLVCWCPPDMAEAVREAAGTGKGAQSEWLRGAIRRGLERSKRNGRGGSR